MNELIIILKVILGIVLTLIGLVILISLSFYTYKKRTTSNRYRRIEFSILFIFFFWWAHGWDNSETYLTFFWGIAIMGFGFLHLLLWANPIKETKKRKKLSQKQRNKIKNQNGK